MFFCLCTLQFRSAHWDVTPSLHQQTLPRPPMWKKLLFKWLSIEENSSSITCWARLHRAVEELFWLTVYICTGKAGSCSPTGPVITAPDLSWPGFGVCKQHNILFFFLSNTHTVFSLKSIKWSETHLHRPSGELLRPSSFQFLQACLDLVNDIRAL